MKKIKLDPEEQDILDSFERGEWKPVANRSREIARHVRLAKNTLAKDKRVTIRISSKDLEQLQVIAVEDGLPYQTLPGVRVLSNNRRDSWRLVAINAGIVGDFHMLADWSCQVSGQNRTIIVGCRGIESVS
jgi:predicted DNA binding CopG/RHH family protein